MNRPKTGEPFPILSTSETGLADYIASNVGYWRHHKIALASVARDPETRRWMVTLEPVQ